MVVYRDYSGELTDCYFLFLIQLQITDICTNLICPIFSTSSNKELVGRVVFGEARNEDFAGQLAVAYTIVNRVRHSSYPNSIPAVARKKHRGMYEYRTMGEARHTRDWEKAKKDNNSLYKKAIRAASSALCGTKSDPTVCATAFCGRNPCSSTDNNRFSYAYNKMKIGSHWFVCRKPIRS